MNAADVLTNGGIQRAETVVSTALSVGLPVALAAAILEQESGGGRNVWGHDPVDNRSIYVPGAPVTEQAYRRYKPLADRGEIGRQGVGPMQLTGRDWQDAADARGGCWDPAANMAAGFTGLVTLTNKYGITDGVRRYNGSGPAAERYRDTVLARYRVWTTRLAGATTTPEDDDMQPDERAALLELRDGLRAAGIGKGRLPGRGEVMKSITDDAYGWTLNSAGKAAEALAEVQRLRADLEAGKLGGVPELDYDLLAKALLRQMNGDPA